MIQADARGCTSIYQLLWVGSLHCVTHTQLMAVVPVFYTEFSQL